MHTSTQYTVPLVWRQRATLIHKYTVASARLSRATHITVEAPPIKPRSRCTCQTLISPRLPSVLAYALHNAFTKMGDSILQQKTRLGIDEVASIQETHQLPTCHLKSTNNSAILPYIKCSKCFIFELYYGMSYCIP